MPDTFTNFVQWQKVKESNESLSRFELNNKMQTTSPSSCDKSINVASWCGSINLALLANQTTSSSFKEASCQTGKC
jgi:hypothetical protein